MSHTTTDFEKLKIYKEKGKIVISKKSKFLGVVYLETDEEIREVGAYLYKLVVNEDKKTWNN